MAGSSISAMSAARNVAVDRNNSFSKNDSVKLDVVLNENQNGGGGGSQSPLRKIVTFRPTQLKNLNANIERNVAQRKQASQTREAQQSMSRERINRIKAENPFKNPMEAQVGSKIDLSA